MRSKRPYSQLPVDEQIDDGPDESPAGLEMGLEMGQPQPQPQPRQPQPQPQPEPEPEPEPEQPEPESEPEPAHQMADDLARQRSTSSPRTRDRAAVSAVQRHGQRPMRSTRPYSPLPVDDQQTDEQDDESHEILGGLDPLPQPGSEPEPAPSRAKVHWKKARTSIKEGLVRSWTPELMSGKSGLQRWSSTLNEEEDRQLITELTGHTNRTKACRIFGNDRKAISASDDNTLRVWDLETNEETLVLGCDRSELLEHRQPQPFPQFLGPFSVQETMLKPHFQFKALQYSIPRGQFKSLAERSPLSARLWERFLALPDDELSAAISKPYRITLPREARPAAGIPEEATHFVWAHRLKAAEKLTDDEIGLFVNMSGEAAFVINGGYVWFKLDDSVASEDHTTWEPYRYGGTIRVQANAALETAEQPTEDEAHMQQECGAEEDADGAGGSVVAAATREVQCRTDEQLMGAIEGVEKAATLKKVRIPFGSKVTAAGMRDFAERARQLQKEGGMTRDFELMVYGYDWSEGQLGSLAGVALSKLNLSMTEGVTSADVAAFAEGARQLQEQEEGGMTRDFELYVWECDWSEGQLGSLAGVALSKLTLRGTKGVTSAELGAFPGCLITREVQCNTDDKLMGAIESVEKAATLKQVTIYGASALVTTDGWRKFAERAWQLQEKEEGGMTRDFELEVEDCDWSDGQLASLAGVDLSKLSLYCTKGVTSADVDAFAKGVQQLQEKEEGGMTRDFELKVINCDWSDGQLVSLAGVALSKLTLSMTEGVTSADVAAFAKGVQQLQEQEEGGMTRDFELTVINCDWSNGQLVSLAGVALSKLTLDDTKGVTSADVAAFAEGARKLQEQEEGGMTRDFELTVVNCDWTPDHVLAALSKNGPSYGQFDVHSGFLTATRAADCDLELLVKGCDWSERQLASLAGVALSKLTLDSTKGMTSADVSAFAEGARQLQEQEGGRMMRDFELTVINCSWGIDHLRAALSKGGPSYRSFPNTGETSADWTRLVAKRIVDKDFCVEDITMSSSPELSAFLELVVAILRSPTMAVGSDSSVDELSATSPEGADATGKGESETSDKQRVTIILNKLEDKYPAAWDVMNLHGGKYNPVLVPTAVPPLQLAVAMAAHCKEWAALYPSDTDTLEDFATQFDEHAAALLDQCNSPQEAERLLLAHFTEAKLAGGSRVPVLDFALRHDVRRFAANRWVQGYATELWTGADVHFAPRNDDDKSAVRDASELITNLHKNLATQLLAVPLLCLGTTLMTVAITFSSLMGLGGSWAIVPVCIGLGTLAAIQLGIWSVWTWLLLVPLLLASAFSWVLRGELDRRTHNNSRKLLLIMARAASGTGCIGLGALAVIQLGIWSLWTWLLLVPLLMFSAHSWLTRNKIDRADAHDFSRNLFLSVSLAWNTPFIKYSLFVQLYLFFVLAVTTLATADRQVVGWPELAVYIFGAGLLVAEVTQLMHGKTAGWWKELRNHLSSLWNVLDVSIVALIAICAYQRVSLTVTTENANAGSGSSVAAESMEQGSGSAAAMNADEITEWR
eukprot:COSAG06_NODE_1412_length_9542_cov_6.906703_3_plen_1539_part_01